MTREEAIKELDWARFPNDYFLCEAINLAIEVLKQTRWIPVSERLPEETERVLLYAERNAYDDKGVFRKNVIDIGWQVGGIWHIDGCNGVDGIAWMPLPDPYEE